MSNGEDMIIHLIFRLIKKTLNKIPLMVNESILSLKKLPRIKICQYFPESFRTFRENTNKVDI